MTYYEHATAMSFKLDRWSEDRPLKNYELEALACQRRSNAISLKKPSALKRALWFCQNALGARNKPGA